MRKVDEKLEKCWRKLGEKNGEKLEKSWRKDEVKNIVINFISNELKF